MQPIAQQPPFRLIHNAGLHAGTLQPGVLESPSAPAETIFVLCDTPTVLHEIIAQRHECTVRRSCAWHRDVLISLIYFKIRTAQCTRYYGAWLNPLDSPIFRHLTIQPTLRLFYMCPDQVLWDVAQSDNTFRDYARKIQQLLPTYPPWSEQQFLHAVGDLTIPFPMPQDFWKDLDHHQPPTNYLPPADIASFQQTRPQSSERM